jgi:subtilisin family serine protease
VAAPIARGDQAVPTNRYIFKQSVSLTLDSSRIAVHVGENGDAAAAVAAVGLDPATITPTALAGWSMVSVPAAPAGSSAGVDGYVAALAAQGGGAGAGGVDFASPVFIENGRAMWVMGEMFADFDASMKAEDRDALVNAQLKVVSSTHGWIPNVDRFTLSSHSGYEVLAAANALSQNKDVRFAEPNWALVSKLAFIPNDTYFNTQWGMHNTGQNGGVAGMDINATAAWDITQGASTLRIAVLDVGVELAHPDLNIDVGLSYDATGNGTGGAPGNACDNHGTGVAGCIVAKINNNLGVAGVAPNCKVVSIRNGVSIMPCTDSTNTTVSALGGAIDYARTSGCKITNASQAYSMLAVTETAYQNAFNAGIVNFAACGNESASSIDYPASSAYVLAVGAIDRTGTIASFSNTGTGLAFVAPGVDLTTTDRTGADGYVAGDYVGTSGTSGASPYAAGVAALMLSVNPNLTPTEIGTIMKNTAVDRGAPGYDTTYGWGFVNAYNALNALPPINDHCSAAIPVGAGGAYAGTLVNATNDGPSSCGSSSGNPDVWYSFANGGCPVTLTVTTCGTNDTGGTDLGVDTVLTVFASCGGAELACNDDELSNGCGESGQIRDSRVNVFVNANQTVLIRVSKYGPSILGTFQLQVTTSLANDACASALAINAETPTPFCNVGATTDGPAEPLCLNAGDSNINSDLWYRYTTHQPGRFVVHTCGSSFDTKLGLYPNACPGAPGAILACNDDDCGLQSTLSYVGVANTTYLIRIGGYTTHTGTGVLEVYCSADFNLSGTVEVQDIFDFLNAWFAGNLAADFNGGGISVPDIFDFLNAWFGGC